MARYVFITATDTIGNLEAASPQTSNDISDMADNQLAIGYGDEVSTILAYANILSIGTAIHKLLNSARDRGYIITNGTGNIHHYSIKTEGTRRDVDGALDPIDLTYGIVDRPTLANVNGEISFAIGEDFHINNVGAGASRDRSPYSSQVVDKAARLALRFLMDYYLKVNEDGVGIGFAPPAGPVFIPDAALVGPAGTDWISGGSGGIVNGGSITFGAQFGSLTNGSLTGIVVGVTYAVTFAGGAPTGSNIQATFASNSGTLTTGGSGSVNIVAGAGTSLTLFTPDASASITGPITIVPV